MSSGAGGIDESVMGGKDRSCQWCVVAQLEHGCC